MDDNYGSCQNEIETGLQHEMTNHSESFKSSERSATRNQPRRIQASLLVGLAIWLVIMTAELSPFCPLECGTGGICVPDTTFGALSAQHHSETASFRCDCFAGYSGTLCQIHKDRAVDNAEFADDSNAERGDDDFFDSLFLPSDGCSFECQNGGKCMSIFGGVSYGCLCVEPFWGSQCEVNGLSEPCELDCSSIVSTGLSQSTSYS